jgi:hypothetical protein
MSVRAFERKFGSSFHLTPQKYLRKLRLRMASRALVYTNLPLAKVALHCGFVDQSHFSREFRRLFGRTPRDYRAHYSLGSPLALPSPASDGGRGSGEGDAASGTISAALEQDSASPSPLSSSV